MNDRPMLNDNPSDHDVLIVMVNNVANYMEHDREWKASMSQTLHSLDDKVGLQNGNVARLTLRANQHDAWHGDNDERLASRVSTLWDDRSAALIRRGVYLTWGRAAIFLVGVAGSFGVGGLLIGRLT